MSWKAKRVSGSSHNEEEVGLKFAKRGDAVWEMNWQWTMNALKPLISRLFLPFLPLIVSGQLVFSFTPFLAWGKCTLTLESKNKEGKAFINPTSLFLMYFLDLLVEVWLLYSFILLYFLFHGSCVCYLVRAFLGMTQSNHALLEGIFSSNIGLAV